MSRKSCAWKSKKVVLLTDKAVIIENFSPESIKILYELLEKLNEHIKCFKLIV